MRSARAGTEKELVLFIRSFADQISNLGGNWLEMEIPSIGCHRAVGDLGGGWRRCEELMMIMNLSMFFCKRQIASGIVKEGRGLILGI